jgi:glycosyltransferase involved in cell wall biosynthesis
MRILLLTTDAFGARGGIAQYNRDFIAALCSDRRCTEVVAVPRHAPESPGPLPGKLRFVANGSTTKGSFIKSAVREAFAGRKFDLIVCGHINLLPLAVLASQRHRVPLVLMIYGIDAWTAHRSAIVNAIAKRVDAVASISQITLNKFHEWAGRGNAKSFILPNAIDGIRYSSGPRDKPLLERYGLTGKKVLLTVGRLSASERYKGIDEVLEVFPGLHAEIPRLAYLVIGDGDDRVRLEKKARSLPGHENIVFAGYVAEGEKVAHYRLADAYVMPSRGEGFGFVFLEALACGIPVVASGVDGGREAVRDGLLGSLVNPSSPADIARGIKEALGRTPGVVPDGLDYFSYTNFEKRVHGLLEAVVPFRAAAEGGSW